MKEPVLKFVFDRQQNKQNEYINNSENKSGLLFDWFRITPTRQESILKTGAEQCLEFYNGHRWQHITGLYKIDRCLFYGDIEKETAAIWIHPGKEYVKIAIFKGHRPKYRTSRKKRIIRYLTNKK